MQDTDHTHGTKRRALTATVAITGSRILGLVREQVFAFFFGASATLDAFVVAFRIPNLLRDLAAEGALSQSFVTVFAQKISTGEKTDAFKLANKLSTFIICSMLVVVIVGEIFAPAIVSAVATGFAGEKFDLTVRLLRLLFPYILFVSLSALIMGMLNAQKKFFVPFSSSTFGNIVSIVAGLLCAYLMAPDYIVQTTRKILAGVPFTTTDSLAVANAIIGMAIGTLLSGLGQYLFQLPTAHGLGFRPRLDFGFNNPDLIRVLKLTGPAVIAGAAVQVNVLVNTEFASLLGHGAVSYLNFAFRFMQFPLGIFGVAIAAASAPVLAQMIVQKRETNFVQTIQSSLQMSFFFSIPSTIGLIVLGQDIIALIYEHGQFSFHDTMQTGYALMAYALGIASYSIIKIYQPAYLAFDDARTPMRISLFSIALNLGINALFVIVLHYAHWSLALGTAVVATTNLILLCYFFRRHIRGIWSREVLMNLLKTTLAGIIMGIGVWYLQGYLRDLFSERTLTHKTLLVFIPLCLACPLYFTISYVLQIRDAVFFVERLKRKLG